LGGSLSQGFASNFSSIDDESKSVHSESENNDKKMVKKDFWNQENQLETTAQLNAVLSRCVYKAPEFSSLNFIAKRMNEENKHELYKASHISEVMNDIKSALDYSKSDGSLTISSPRVSNECSLMSNEDLLAYIKERTEDSENDDILDVTNIHSEWVEALKVLHSNLTDSQLPVDKDGNICLKLELDSEEHREFMTQISTIKLPEIHTLEINSFYDGDDDLEKFLSNSIVSVNNLILGSDSFWVDSHDYIPLILSIPCIHNLYIKGFLIDSEDAELLIGKSNAKKLMLESWNVAIDEFFKISESHCSENYFGQAHSLLKSVWFINDEMDHESMRIFVNAVKDSYLSNTLKDITVTDCFLSQDTIDALKLA
jgi:hypothetical protein